MQTLYALNLDVACAADGTSAFDNLAKHLVNWLAYKHGVAPSLGEFSQPGRLDLPAGETHATVSWEVLGDGETTAIRLDHSQPQSVGNSYFVTRVTISGSGSDPTKARLRIALSREIRDGWLSPAPLDYLRRPALVSRVLQDSSIRATIFDQHVDGRFHKIIHSAQLGALVHAVRSTNRLPLLVADPIAPGGTRFPFSAATELAGLATVVCLKSISTLREFNAAHPRAAVPFGGARLIWADPRLEHPSYSRERCEAEEPQLAFEIMRVLAPLSVIARGVDNGWDAARRASTRQQAENTKRRLEAAREAGNQSDQVAVLEAENIRLEAEVNDWVAFGQELEAQNVSLENAASEAESWRYQAENWKGLYFDRVAGTSERVGQLDLDDAPELYRDNAQPLLDHLEATTNGSLRFTENAVRSWRKSNYELPERMREHLIRLARASVDFAGSQGEMDDRLPEWFRRFELIVATTDNSLKQSGATDFEFDGEMHSGIPHVKVGDQTIASRCGRVHFDYQSDPPRFIVNHIGTHL